MTGRVSRAALIAVALGAISCRPARGPQAPGANIVIVAPHPDDETLLAAGVLMDARARGAHASVIVVTNGDFTCERDGHVREGETVAALAKLGVAEDDVHFLGYPDGWLSELGDVPLPPIDRRALDGSCQKATGTYGEHGASRHDEHTARTGAPAPYDARSLEGDLAALFTRLHPDEVYVTHPLDRHPDHAMTYAYVRRALDAVGAHPRVHRGIVHAGPCWPNGRGMTEPCPPIEHGHDFASPMPELPPPYASYVPPERFGVADPSRKLAAIFAYRSQLGADPDHDWLTSFARDEEPFWPEQITAPAGEAQGVLLSPQSPVADVAPYHLALDATAETVTLSRDGSAIGKWTLPLDGRDKGHSFALRPVAKPDEHAVEVSVVREGKLIGVGIDPR